MSGTRINPLHKVRRACSAFVVAVAIVGYLIATTGVAPNPSYFMTRIAQSSGERFPCQGGRCMCASARECWTTCRCHTLAQKVAWAEREGVAVPDYVDLSSLDRCEPAKPACPLCAVADGAPADDDNTATATEREPSAMPTLTAAGCKGIDLLLALGVMVTVTVPSFEYESESVETELPCFDETERLESLAMDIPTPPPRA